MLSETTTSELEALKGDSGANCRIINVGTSSQQRGLVHEWAKENGYISMSEYVRDEKRIHRVCCMHCSVWNNLEKADTGNDFEGQYLICDECCETTPFDEKGDSDEITWKKYPRPTGFMIIMKVIEPNYRNMTPTPKGWWRDTRKF
jgi:hypothetical protein